MAKTALKKAFKFAMKDIKPGRRVGTATPTKTFRATSPAKKNSELKAPIVSKDELRAQLEKALTMIAALRIKGREAVRADKAPAAHIDELGAKVAQLEKKLLTKEKPTSPASPAGETQSVAARLLQKLTSASQSSPLIRPRYILIRPLPISATKYSMVRRRPPCSGSSEHTSRRRFPAPKVGSKYSI